MNSTSKLKTKPEVLELAWLENKTDPKVISFLENENKLSDQYFKKNQKLKDKIYKDLLKRIKESDQTFPYPSGSYSYWSETKKGKNYSVLWRKKNTPGSKKEIVIDQNQEAKGRKYFSLGALSLSPDEQSFVYSVDEDGSEQYKVYWKDLKKKKVVELEKMGKISGSVSYTENSDYLIYSTFDATKRPDRVWLFKISTGEKKEIYHDPDESYFVSFHKSESKKYFFIGSHSKVTSEVFYTDSLDSWNVPLKRLQPRIKGIEASISHQGDYFYKLTNENAINFKVLRTNLSTPDQWEEFLPHSENRLLEEMEAFQDQMVFEFRKNGLTGVLVKKNSDSKFFEIPAKDEAYVMELGTNRVYQTNKIRYEYESPIQPPAIFEFDLQTMKSKKLYEKPVPQFQAKNYRVKRLFAKSHDGVMVPYTMIERKDFKNKTLPVVIRGYGSYGISSDPVFSTNFFALVDQGVRVVTAHLRGGSEMGRSWYEDGKFLKKKNTFYDLIAVSEDLIKKKLTKKKKIAIVGGSAGGLLVGATMNMRPDLFGAVAGMVPFVDVYKTMMSPHLPLTVTEYDEWGNPEEAEYGEYIYSYSPVDQVHDAEYPSVLATGGLNDPRVSYWEPAKWVIRLREHQKDTSKVILLKTEMSAGHAGPSGRYSQYAEVSELYTFLLTELKKN